MTIGTKKMPSVMQGGHSFARVPTVATERSVFDRSHGYKTTFDSGLLIPCFVDYVMPGDTYNCKMSAFARLTTPIKPFMDNMYLDSFFFFVPFRLIWTNFVKMMGEQVNPGDSISYTVPQVVLPAAGLTVGRLGDYFGLPTAGTPAITASISVSTLVNRAFWKIYNQWFRDENLINSIPNGSDMSDGPDTIGASGLDAAPPKRGKRHDYFTSCLPSPQKGTVASTLPLGTSAPVTSDVADNAVISVVSTVGAGLRRMDGSPLVLDIAGGNPGGTGLYADLSVATGATVNQLRQAITIQQFLEKDARGGTRYPELVLSHYGVRSSDQRLQRAEYLGGGSSPIMVAPIAQTTQAGAPTFKDGLANLGGQAATIARGHGFNKSFEEHGVIIGIVSVRADLTYSQGVERFWKYLTRYDFPFPVFAHLGEQSVLNSEIFATGAAADANVFGYQERYAECRYKPSRITGLFRPTAAGSLELWHLSEKFSALPTLGQTFIEDQTETVLDTRVAVPTEPDWYFDAWFELKCARPLPVFGVPGLKRL